MTTKIEELEKAKEDVVRHELMGYLDAWENMDERQRVEQLEYLLHKKKQETLAEVEKMIDECKVYNPLRYHPCIQIKELKQKLKEMKQ